VVTRLYSCPNCPKTLATTNPKQPYHPCRGLRGLLAPFVPAGIRAKVETVERGDWVGRELVQVDGNGRPVMAIQTTRDDGIDCTVLAPCAFATRDEAHGG
jgi:hypothetical protein